MNRLEKALLLGAAGILAYQVVKRQLRPSLTRYYHGKVAIVTGGASGIGRALVGRLRSLGAAVLAVDINERTLAQLSDELPGIYTLAIDLAEKNAPQRVLDEVLTRFGRLDLLFSNAGILFLGKLLEMTDQDIQRLIDVNFVMQVRMTHAILPYFLQRGSGVIAYTGSLSAHVHAPTHSVYTGTKGGLNNFVGAMRRELPTRSGVQLTIIHPNITRTNLVEQSAFDELDKVIDLQTPQEVAEAFLRGISHGAREVFVRPRDHFYKWAERLTPTLIDREFRKYFESEEEKKRQQLNETAEGRA